ncbi:hypothetical protein [Pluralibacter gergoviae]|uniref:hypothetical protein n=1 Tax=Pluralibacter gergoviae TaxID=61647 RepID=UPI00290C4FB9|nr:hypothetical protein [Pluralibacter gergoviae]MDU4001415.1 hypothetical protein [Pluralibacter gergoviae]
MTKPTIYTVAHPDDLSPPVKTQGFCVDVVLASDYAELEREIRAYEATVANIEQRVTELAAENVALKAFGDKLSEMHNALNGEGTGIQGRAEVACQQVALEAAMEEFDDIETPATDRIVAGIKADGVEEFVERCREKSAQAISSDIRDNWWLAGEHADDFAKQLREGPTNEQL